MDRDGFIIQRTVVEYGVPCLTSLDTAKAIVTGLSSIKEGEAVQVAPLQDWV